MASVCLGLNLLKFEGDIVYFISDIIVSADVSLEKLQWITYGQNLVDVSLPIFHLSTVQIHNLHSRWNIVV